jgi:curved DNA-binding protein
VPQQHCVRGNFIMSGDDFVDYYQILQVGPTCNAKTLEAAYRHLAKMYHPDHPDTADSTKFKVLRNHDKRAKYDQLYAEKHGKHWFEPASGGDIDDGHALNDAESHAKILMYLYNKRRENAQKAGVIGFYLQDLLKCSDEHFEFHKWYLKEKGLIAITEQGTLAITIEGVDHVIAMSRTTRAEKLLIAQATAPDDE